MQTVEVNASWICLWEENVIVSYICYIDARFNYELRRRKLCLLQKLEETVKHKVLGLTVGCTNRGEKLIIYLRRLAQ